MGHPIASHFSTLNNEMVYASTTTVLVRSLRFNVWVREKNCVKAKKKKTFENQHISVIVKSFQDTFNTTKRSQY